MTSQPDLASAVLPFAFDRLIQHLAQVGLRVDAEVIPTRCAGGLANLNYEMRVNDKPVILRRAPSGPLPKGAHDMAREHRVLSRLSEHFPLAPRSLYLCEDAQVIGAPFQVIEFRKGRVFRGDDLRLLRPGEDLQGSLTGLLADVMAGLHAIPPHVADLDGLGRHQGFMVRNANRWAEAAGKITTDTPYAGLAQETAAAVRATFEDWNDGSATILHCDMKLDNMILATDALTPVALVDWDMATLGDPMFDLATLLSYWAEPGDPEVMLRLKQMPTAHPGFPSRSDMAAAYERASGRSLSGLEPARALCQLKLGVIFLQLHARWKDGSVGDSRYAAFQDLGADLLEFARDVAMGRRS